MKQVSIGISRLCLWLSGIGLIAMSLIIMWQVFARYILNNSPSWSEASALFLMIWTVLFAAAAGVREGFHIRITAGVDALPVPIGRGAKIIADIIVALLGLYLLVFGAQLVMATWSINIPTLGLPRGAAYLPLPIAGAFIAFFAVERVLTGEDEDKVPPAWN